MCSFFSLVSNGNGFIYYIGTEYREKMVKNELLDRNGNRITEPDSHTSIMAYHGIYGEEEDKYNKWEYDPKSDYLLLDTLNTFDDREKVLEKIKQLDFTKIRPISEYYLAREDIKKRLVCEVGDKILITPSIINCEFGTSSEMISDIGKIFAVTSIDYDEHLDIIKYRYISHDNQWIVLESDFAVA